MRSSNLVRAAGLCALMFAVACSDGDSPAEPNPNPAPPAVASVQVDPGTATLPVGQTKQLGAVVKDGAGNVLNGRAVTWTSSDTGVATVSAGGLVTAVSVGNAVIKAASEGKEGTAAVAVSGVAVASVSIVAQADTIEAYETLGLTAIVRDSAGQPLAGRTVTWSSSDPAVATVNAGTGQVSGVDRGTVTITASSEGKSDTAQLVVVIRYRSITAGTSHACNLASGGIAWCWGVNGREGRIGSPVMNDGAHSATPVRVPGDHRFVQVATYSRTTCGLTAQGKVWCWGTNGWGTLGIGTTTPAQSHEPVQVTGGQLYKQIAAGGTHMCALTVAGKAYCWGTNGSGELGNGNRTFSPAPVAAAADLTFTSLVASSEFTCGITASGQGWCWGYDGLGNLGDGRPISYGNTYVLTPVQIAGGHSFAALSSGQYTTCGVTTANQAFCWGRNGGKFGNGGSADSSIPVAVGGGHSFRAVSEGFSHGCGLTLEDAVYCWGGNGNGQLGAPGLINGSTVPVRAAGTLLAAEVAAANIGTGSASFTCAISQDRLTTYCWGRNDGGQLGNGTVSTSSAVNHEPTIVVGQQPL